MHIKKLMLSLFLFANLLTTTIPINCFASKKAPPNTTSTWLLSYSPNCENPPAENTPTESIPAENPSTENTSSDESSIDSINELDWDLKITLKLLNGTIVEESEIIGSNPNMPKNKLIEIHHTDHCYEAYSCFPESNYVDFRFSTSNYDCVFKINTFNNIISYFFKNNTGFKIKQDLYYKINGNVLSLFNINDGNHILYTFCPTYVFKTIQSPGLKNTLSPHIIPDIVSRNLNFVLNNKITDIVDKVIDYYITPNENDF